MPRVRMLMRLRRLALVVALFVLGIIAGRVFGSTRSAGTQLALTYHDRTTGADTTLLVDTTPTVTYRLSHPRYHANIKLLGWVNTTQLVIMFPAGFDLTYYATFTIGHGWSDTLTPTLPIVSLRDDDWPGSSDANIEPILSPDEQRIALRRIASDSDFWDVYVLDREGNLRSIVSHLSSAFYDWRPCPEAGC